MASTPTIPEVAMEQGQNPEEQAAAENSSETALVPVEAAPPEPVQDVSLSPPVAALPVELDVSVPVREFRVRNLLALEPGQIVETEWGHGEDVPLASGEVQLTWSEFEVVESQLAVRITRLA